MAGDSDSSELSSASEGEVRKLAPIFMKAKRATKKVAPPPKASLPRPKRAPSPPHEDVLADNPDIAFLVMFRSRFHAAFPPKLAHFGPQDIERGIVDSVPSQQVEALLCALLGLVLNRKKPVENGHYGRALEEAMLSHKAQWPNKWNGRNPLHGGKDFNNMTPEERLNLLRTLVIWALTSSEAISTTIKDSYKQSRHNDDENQPLSLQPWGKDGDKRRYFLVEGQDDTSFRIYREGTRPVDVELPMKWYSMAGDIEETRKLAERLDKEDGSQAARTLGQRMLNAIPRFEATEEKRRRREYRQSRRAAFTRPEPGFSLYEGRTRGKRMRYTFDDDDDLESDATSTRRSARQSTRNTPSEPTGPTYTASGRQVKPRQGGEYGASLLSGQATSADDTPRSFDEDEDSEQPVRSGRATRAAGRGIPNGESNLRKRKHADGYDSEMSDEEDAPPSGEEWDSDANDNGDEKMPDVDDEDDEDDGDDLEPSSLVVTLKFPKNRKVEDTAAPQVPSDGSTLPGALKAEPSSSLPNGTANGVSGAHTPSTSLHPPHGQSLSDYPTPVSVPPSVAAHKVDSGAMQASKEVSEEHSKLKDEPPSNVTSTLS